MFTDQQLSDLDLLQLVQDQLKKPDLTDEGRMSLRNQFEKLWIKLYHAGVIDNTGLVRA